MKHRITEADITLARGRAACFARRTRTLLLLEEWESAALLGLVEAASAFDPSHKVKFSSYAIRRIDGAILDESRRQMPQGFRRGAGVGRRGEQPQIHSLDRAHDGTDFEDGSGRDTSLCEQVADGCDPVGWEVDWHDELDALARMLPPTFGRALRIYYGAAPTAAATAAILGVSRSRVSQCITASHHYLSESLLADPEPEPQPYAPPPARTPQPLRPELPRRKPS